jgi:hypothetical protein
MATHGVPYREQNVSVDRAALAAMVKKSGQSKAPTLDWHGKILADFDVAELVPFLHAQGVELEES